VYNLLSERPTRKIHTGQLRDSLRGLSIAFTNYRSYIPKAVREAIDPGHRSFEESVRSHIYALRKRIKRRKPMAKRMRT
jgi:hypothetical protein